MTLQRTRYFLVPVALLVLFAGTTPASAFASSYARTNPLHAATTASPPLSREIFGFALASSLSDPTVGYGTWDFSLLTTVAFFGLHVQDDGTFASDSGAAVWNSAQLTNLVTVAHAHGTKVVLTIVEHDFSPGSPHMCSALASSATTITNTVNGIKAKGVDGVNVDYEGLNGACGSADTSYARHAFTAFVTSLRRALPAGSYLSVDTYASSAADLIGFFDISGISASVDSFFVMAYDLEYSNYSRAPTRCSTFCLGPTSPLSGYYYTDASTAQQYLAVTPASKIILGVPYYGRKACVGAIAPNQYPVGGVVADSYLNASQESTSPDVKAGTYATHRDANDPGGAERWDTWYNTSLNCWRELYWDDTASLGRKYDLVNSDGLRGVGIWNLNYGGGAAELWQLLASRFAPGPWTSLGGGLTSSPAASSWSAGRADVFVRGTDNALYHSTWNGSALSAWSSLGGALTSGPAAVSWGPNRIDVFARGSNSALYHRVWAGAWYGWESLGGALTSGPAVASWGTGRLDVFARGTDNGLWHRFWDGQRWSSWESLGGVLTSDPAAVSWGPNRIDVFASGTDNALYHRWSDGIHWYGWERLGGVLTSSPAAASCSSGHLAIFATGGGSATYELRFDGAWGSWQSLGGQWTSGPGVVCLTGTTTDQLFERGTDNGLWQRSVPAA